MPTLQIKTLPVFEPLLQPARYKGAWGGRGSAKSHFFAEYVIEQCVHNPPMRAVCLREIQNSLRQSVKLLIEDKIQKLGVGRSFRVLEDRIEAPRGGMIIFNGMQNHTAESIKSLEGFRIAWFEEAQSMSKFSLGLLRPTLRNDAELLFSWNPRKASDPIDQFLRSGDLPKRSIVVRTSYEDNYFFPDDLRDEMEYDKRRDPDRYAHVWLGEYEKRSEARVFHNWKVEEFETPSDARFRFGCDWGFSIDPTVLVRCFIKGRTLLIDHEAWKIGCEIDYTPALFAGNDTARNPPRWPNPYGYKGIPGSTTWPIIADSANPQSISYLARLGFNIRSSIKGAGSIEEGIEFLKGYDIVVHPRCKHTIDEFSTYSYKVDPKTDEILPVLEDKKNHVIDSVRYGTEPERRAPAVPLFTTQSLHP